MGEARVRESGWEADFDRNDREFSMCLLANQFIHANYRMAYSPSPDQPCISLTAYCSFQSHLLSYIPEGRATETV